ncbi:glycosyltransferase family 2 protein [Mesorhizobium sp. ASY16-5R]|uniref:glycosyltransferase family 2 protein n=1 Tax=Mesorhizobium sp. ASY16-5R TaxID=3445772 RepID=UPI003F9FFA3F
MASLPANASISIVASSPNLDHDSIEAVVTVPTFRRPQQVLDTLQSLRNQKTKRRFAVVLVENEAEKREGAAAAKSWFDEGLLQGMLIIAHDRGNCCAYNAGFLTTITYFPNFKYALVVDDDELADPDWLENMCATAERFGVDVVGGPQIPVFARPEHNKWAAHPVFSAHYRQTGPVPILYSSGNMLLSRKVMDTMGPPYLDLRFNFMGGGDADFLSRTKQRGFELAWCDEAIIRETVPERRVEADWIRARSLRNGVISTLVEKKKRAGTPLANTKVFVKSLLLLAASPFRGFLKLCKTGSISIALYPVYIGAGRVMAEFGYANEQYRQPEKN